MMRQMVSAFTNPPERKSGASSIVWKEPWPAVSVWSVWCQILLSYSKSKIESRITRLRWPVRFPDFIRIPILGHCNRHLTRKPITGFSLFCQQYYSGALLAGCVCFENYHTGSMMLIIVILISVLLE